MALLAAAVVSLSSVSAFGESPAVHHKVRRGETLSSIAAKYGTNVTSICRWNAMKPTAMLTPGKTIGVPLPPGARMRTSERAATAPKQVGQTWRSFAKAPERPGHVELVSYTDEWEGDLLGQSGKVLAEAQEAVDRVFLSPRADLAAGIDPRLIQLMAEVSDVFGGRRIHVVSGYRGPGRGRPSRHAMGRAIDFYVEGVPNWAVRDFVLTLERVGVGYYPNSFHVHLDVRERKTYWVDVSRPGQRAHYVKPTRYAKRARTRRRQR
jgi:uncharacterized protein YcbK (DUF882 family)